ncbi:restriction endonuclease [Microbacterium sp. 77mftsu3.1]|uniref:restriction endonuclease n=1 Tax=Microbacterium sp. 77mftsu3.1 TaxID=1761802 RepID=UPI000368FDD6|nr:restriction endonuclease [Microbacterium sp. 77mftsu3.1]SDH42953.1 Restriction endonuclease [Microbacterium sp. 77mftsu3.1]
MYAGAGASARDGVSPVYARVRLVGGTPYDSWMVSSTARSARSVEDQVHLAAAELAGERFAAEYPNPWAPVDAIEPDLDEFAEARAVRILGPRKGAVHMYEFWIAGGLCVSIAVLSTVGKAPWTSTFGTISFLVMVGCLIAGQSNLKRMTKRYEERTVTVREAVVTAAHAGIERRRQAARSYDPSARTSPWRPLGPAPAPQPFGVSHEGAEHLVQQWMLYLGAFEAEVTRFSADGGVDVAALNYIAQVKNYGPGHAVDVAAVRELAGVAGADGRKPLFFTSSGYTSGAAAFAASVGMALFVYDAAGGTLSPVGSRAERAVSAGL